MTRSLHLPHHKLVGTLWSSRGEIQGWNHFVVVGLMKLKETWHVEMAAVCEKEIRFIVEKKVLKDASRWTPGIRRLTIED